MDAARFVDTFREFEQLSGAAPQRFALDWEDRYPCLADDTAVTGFDEHYVYHPAWAARILAQTRPEEHVDISSTLHFCSIVSAFVPVRFYDYRPARLDLDGLASGRADLTALPFPDRSIASLSCMHTVEHVGLGRYGDPVDPEGDVAAMRELGRVVAPGGSLLFVVPVGEPRVHFNAHRVYAYRQVVDAFPDFELREFALVRDDGVFVRHADETLADEQRYGCGCFWLVRREDGARAPVPERAARPIELRRPDAAANVVVLSKDRACQLDLFLRSADRFAGDERLRPTVLYTASTVELARGYERVAALHPGVRFVCELGDPRSFRDHVLELVDPGADLTVFFVDDDVFRAPFSLDHPLVEQLRTRADVSCLSLRLCDRIAYTYTLDEPCRPPAIADGTFRWGEGGGAWDYPMSLDGHVFRTADLLPLLARLDYVGPNALESALAGSPLPQENGLCPEDAAIVNVPANRVQDRVANRNAGVPVEELNRRFLAGERIALEPLAARRNVSVHEELAFDWEPEPVAVASPSPFSAPSDYGLKPGYRGHPRPIYWDDDVDLKGITWQPEVYTDAAAIATVLGARRIVDVGCGTAGKLAALHPRFEIVGVDFGSNLDVCRARYPFGTWLEHDLEQEVELPVPPELLADAVVVCADVVEHLVRPELLLRKLRTALVHARAVLLSTPERDLARGRDHMGPPPKQHHVREWTLRELGSFLEFEGFEHGAVMLTRSNDQDIARHTILAKLFPDGASAAAALAGALEIPCSCAACAAAFAAA